MTSEEINNSKELLAKWQSPFEMREYCAGLMNKLGNETLFTQAGLEFIREGWAAGEFGNLLAAVSVRLVADTRPDLALRFDDGRQELYEIVEAIDPRRRRGLEYREKAAAGYVAPNLPVEKWATGEQASDVLRRAARTKAAKAQELEEAGTPYPQGTNLLIYLNISDFGAHQQEIEATFTEAVESARKWFSSIWILWNARAYRVSED